MADRDEKDLEKVAQRVEAAHGYLHIEERAAELAKLDEEIAQPGFWDDASHAQSVSKQASVLRDTIAEYDEAAALLDDARAAFDLASEDELFAEEASEALDKLDELLDALEISSWFSERFDGGDAILTVNPGSGGLEAQDWTDMLYRMYVRYAEKKDWKVTVLDVVPGEGIGLDKATIQIEGRNAFGMLKSESGVHRLVRISPTDDKKRRHTTFAGVEVLPVLPDDIEVDLNPADVRVDVYRSSGPGGQCVNTTDSAVRLTHIPTNIVVTCQNEKSQLQNKEAAFRVLKAKLYEREEQKRQEELAELRGKTDAARADARRAEEKLAAVRREFEDIERQRGEAERTVAEARPSVEALEQRLAGLARQLEEDTARLAEAQDAVVPLRKQAAQVRDALAEAKRVCAEEHDQVIAAGGLTVIGTERHESRRIDNQLRGRSGRQGDPGSSRFYLSMEDPLLRIFAGEKMQALMNKLRLPEGEAIEAGIVSRSIETAQRKVESRNFDIRKQLLEYDDVANDQRKEIYALRNEILENKDVSGPVKELRDGYFTSLFRHYVPADTVEEQWDLEGLEKELKEQWNLDVPLKATLEKSESSDDQELLDMLLAATNKVYDEKVALVGHEAFAQFERNVLLQFLDQRWREHLSQLDMLRQGIYLRGYAQKQPKQEYKREAFELFANLLETVGADVTRVLMNVQIRQPEPEEVAAAQQEAQAPAQQEALPQEEDPFAHVGRNDPCPCGSGKKFKDCHGKLR